MSEYQKEQDNARRRRERKEQRAMRRLRHKLRQDSASLLDKKALEGAQEKLQDALDEERETFLERARYERVSDEQFRGYRNGHGEPRQVHLGSGSVRVRLPRVADNAEPFESGLLPRYQRSSSAVLATLPQLYLYGISTGDFEAALECLLGVGAALSPSTIARLKQRWYLDYEAWRNEPLASHYAYIWADGIYIKVGQNKEKLALLVVMGADAEGRKRILAMIPGQRESYEQWLEVLRDLVRRGVKWVGLAVADGIPGFWRAFGEAFPEARRQRCWVHMIRNVLDKLPKARQQQAHKDLVRIYEAGSKAEAVSWIVYFADHYRLHPPAVKCLLEKQDDLLSYFDFPKEHWRHLKTTNPVESAFAPVKSRVKRAKRLMRYWSALGLVYRLLLEQETRWFRLSAPHLVAAVVAGAKYHDGVEVKLA
ncbi:MAG: IS256 family transposase [candidate division WOR-3 bacterium]